MYWYLYESARDCERAVFCRVIRQDVAAGRGMRGLSGSRPGGRFEVTKGSGCRNLRGTLPH